MSFPLMLTHLLLERLTSAELPRQPEPQALMVESGQVASFMNSGRADGMLNYLYLFHAVMALPLIRPGDVVFDLACGPANQLLKMAALHPEASFVGIDASLPMLQQAEANIAAAGLRNIRLQQADISQLAGVDRAVADCVLCTMSLHHLADTGQLAQTMQQVRRILRPDGGIYLADFGRLKRAATQHFFAYDRVAQQSAQFTEDFLNSMRAAFSVDELRQGAALLGAELDCHQTAVAPFMVLLHSPARHRVDSLLAERAQAAYRDLSPLEQRDFNNLARWFRLGGLSLPCALPAAGRSDPADHAFGRQA